MRLELIPLAMNACIFGAYLYQMQEPGKILYWLGATILTAGLVLMRG